MNQEQKYKINQFIEEFEQLSQKLDQDILNLEEKYGTQNIGYHLALKSDIKYFKGNTEEKYKYLVLWASINLDNCFKEENNGK